MSGLSVSATAIRRDIMLAITVILGTFSRCCSTENLTLVKLLTIVEPLIKVTPLT